MKIVKLQSENIKRLHAIEIIPEGNLITIGGRCGRKEQRARLNQLRHRRREARAERTDPRRRNGRKGRRGVGRPHSDTEVLRAKIHQDSCQSFGLFTPPEPRPACNCTPSFSETKSALVVTNKDGARYPSPQAVLDKLTGRLTFDPLAFAHMDPKQQDATLRKLVGLDVSAIEERRKEAFTQRAMLKKSHDIIVAQLLDLPHHDGVHDEVPMAEISNEMLRVEELRKAAEDAGREVVASTSRLAQHESACQSRYARIEELNKQIATIQSELGKYEALHQAETKTLAERKAAHEAALIAVPDADAIRQKLTDAEATNKKVRENAAYAQRVMQADAAAVRVIEQDELVKAADAEKRAMLEAAKFPVEGLGVGDDGITFGGVPFSQASSSEQLRVSVAIGLALNPKLKVLLIRNGNLLDDDSLKAVADQADQAGAQVWMEYVTKNAEGVSVMIEEGKVVTE